MQVAARFALAPAQCGVPRGYNHLSGESYLSLSAAIALVPHALEAKHRVGG